MSSAVTARSGEPAILERIRSAVEGALEGKPEAVEFGLICLIARGHLLVEDVPGVGKTTLARGLAQVLGGGLQRIQFTSDLLPSDVLGVSVYNQQLGEFTFKKGPIFTPMLLADEINRASPRTQSALLEAMNEGQVSVDGQTLPLPDSFFVIATQNPEDFAGTYPLPESQLDRFMMRIHIGYPPAQVEQRLVLDPSLDRVANVPHVIDLKDLAIIQQDVENVILDPSLATYLHAVVVATRNASSIAIGASPRAAMNLSRAARGRAKLHGRDYCVADDIHALAVPVLAHRVRLASQADGFVASYHEVEATIRDLVARVPVPL